MTELLRVARVAREIGEFSVTLLKVTAVLLLICLLFFGDAFCWDCTLLINCDISILAVAVGERLVLR